MDRHPLLVLAAGVLLAAAPSRTPADDLRGFTSESARAERDWEKKFDAVPSPDSLRSSSSGITRSSGLPIQALPLGRPIVKAEDWSAVPSNRRPAVSRKTCKGADRKKR